MPITIKTTPIKFKDNEGNYKSIDVVGEKLTFDAEAYAVGTRNGTPISGTATPSEVNNAKYYMEQAKTAKQQAESAAQRFTVTIDNNHGLVFHLT